MKHEYDHEYWRNASVPVIPIRDHSVNPFMDEGLEMAVIDGTAIGGTFKVAAADGILCGLREHGLIEPGKRYIDASSGRYAFAMLKRCIAYGARQQQFTFIIKNDVPAAKAGAAIVGGAWTTSPKSPDLDPIVEARTRGGGGWVGDTWGIGNDNTIHTDQYGSPFAQLIYREVIAKKILDAAGEFDYLVCPIGTGAMFVGLYDGLASELGERLYPVGVMCEDGHEIPGMRDIGKMQNVLHPWQRVAAKGCTIKIERDPAFLCSPRIFRSTGVFAGPSGGACLAAAHRLVISIFQEKGLDALHNKKILLVVHDDATPYIGDRYITEYPLEAFLAAEGPRSSEDRIRRLEEVTLWPQSDLRPFLFRSRLHIFFPGAAYYNDGMANTGSNKATAWFIVGFIVVVTAAVIIAGALSSGNSNSTNSNFVSTTTSPSRPPTGRSVTRTQRCRSSNTATSNVPRAASTNRS